MKRNGVTIVELLVALVILGSVTSMAMYTFQSQHQNWKTLYDKVDIGLMAKASIDEISGAIRMTGSGLPPGRAGIVLAVSPAVGVTFVSNASRWSDMTSGFLYDPNNKRLRLAVDSAAAFSDSGFAYFQIQTPPRGVNAAPTIDTMYTLPILERVVHSGSCVSDSLVLDATQLVAAPNSWTISSSIFVPSGAVVYNVDSTQYIKSHDTLFIRPNRMQPMIFALGVDSLILRYHHPVDGWSKTLSTSTPAKVVDMVQVRVVTRSLRPSKGRLAKDPSSKGYVYARFETEVSLRNDSLVNR